MPWVEAGKVRLATNIDGQLSLQSRKALFYSLSDWVIHAVPRHRAQVPGPIKPQVAADLNGGDYYPRKYHLSKFIGTICLATAKAISSRYQSFEIPLEENGDA